jgi:hypothetical protein
MVITGCFNPVVSVPNVKVVEDVDFKSARKPNTIGTGYPEVYVGSKNGEAGLFGKYYAGGEVDHVLPIYNNYAIERVVKLEYGLPPKIDRGYELAPSFIKYFVFFDEYVTVPANSRVDAMIVLKVPRGYKFGVSRFEFRIIVVPTGQGMVEATSEQRWLVDCK